MIEDKDIRQPIKDIIKHMTEYPKDWVLYTKKFNNVMVDEALKIGIPGFGVRVAVSPHSPWVTMYRTCGTNEKKFIISKDEKRFLIKSVRLLKRQLIKKETDLEFEAQNEYLINFSRSLI